MWEEEATEQEKRGGLRQPDPWEKGEEVQQQQPPVFRGAPVAAGHGKRPGATEDPVSERGVRRFAQNHPHAAFGQAQQNTDPETRGQIHRLPLPGAAERRAGLQNGKLQLCGSREAELRLLRVEDGGRLVHVNIPLTSGETCALHGTPDVQLRLHDPNLKLVVMMVAAAAAPGGGGGDPLDFYFRQHCGVMRHVCLPFPARFGDHECLI